MLDKRKVMLSLVTLVFAVILCGAGSAATPGQSTIHKTISTNSQNVGIVVHSTSATTARGQLIYVNSSAKNMGKTSSGSFYAKYYLVSKKTLKNSKIFLGTQYFNSLHPGNYDNMISSFAVPKSMGTGYYYVAAVVDKNHVSFAKDRTAVYSKEIDSGVVTVKTYGQYKWHTYLMPNKNVMIYSQFYNPNIGHVMKQTTEIGYYTQEKNVLFWSITPKLSGKDDYWTCYGSISTPENYYKYIFKPIMIKEGPNH
jgi:hypothetical protein